MTEHKEVCINGAQSLRLEKGIIHFKNYFKQILVYFKFYAHFECILKSVESYEHFCSKKISRSHINLVCVDDKFTKPIVVFRDKMLLMNLLKQLLKGLNTVKK